MTVVSIGNLQMAGKEAFPSLVIKGTQDELRAVAGRVLYSEIKIVPAGEEEIAAGKNGNLWDGKFADMVEALIAVDRRVREAKPTRRYTRDEVLAMLDEIDPGDKGEGGAK